ncbi:hypothetical protein RR51_26270 [Pseudomonas sp. C5pp]|nr:hypothetical protein RR51_26270 [Pseudomonas sp. C5pp]
MPPQPQMGILQSTRLVGHQEQFPSLHDLSQSLSSYASYMTLAIWDELGHIIQLILKTYNRWIQ